MTAASSPPGPLVLGRYALYDEIAVGGMAMVHLGRHVGAAGFSRAVAIKRLQPVFARDPEFVSMFLDEARLAARVVHPNVVSTLDVVAIDREIFLVLEYVHGESLSVLLRCGREIGERVPPEIATSVLCGTLHGLHAAHEATSENGAPLCIVHRDVSPQNLLVGVDGATRVLDFGIAKATVRSHATREGQMKGKLRYMAPEQLRGGEVGRTTDVYAAGVVLWETLTGDRPFSADNEAALFGQILEGQIAPPSKLLPTLPRALDDVVLRALARDPSWRFATAREMAIALESALPPAGPHAVGEWVQRLCGESIHRRERRVRAIEAGRPEPRSMTNEASRDARGPRTETNAAPVPALAPSSVPPPSSPTFGLAPVVASTRPPPPSMPTAPLTAAAAVPAAVQPSVSTKSAAPRLGVVAAAGAAAAVVVVAVRLAATPVVLGQARAGVGPAAAMLSRLSAAAAAPPVLDLDGEPGAADAIDPPAPVESSAAPPARGRPAPSSARPECDPPYYVDDTGIRRVKRPCLR